MQPEDPIRIEDKEYAFDDLPPEAQKMIRYLQFIDKSLNGLREQMEMQELARGACYAQLLQTIKQPEAVPAPAAVSDS